MCTREYAPLNIEILAFKCRGNNKMKIACNLDRLESRVASSAVFDWLCIPICLQGTCLICLLLMEQGDPFHLHIVSTYILS